MIRVAIIGAGFSGTLACVHLLRREGVHVTLIDRTGRFGPGLAYSTPAPEHLLNVPAGNMSAFDDDPSHFLRWAQGRDPGASVVGGSFVARSVYGEYLGAVLRGGMDAAPGRIRTLHAEVRGVEAGEGRGLIVRCAEEAIAVDGVILALGNFPPQPLPVGDQGYVEHPAYVADAWDSSGRALGDLDPRASVLIVGTGLSMMDMVMSLHARDHAGRVLALSRHGLLPRPHRSPSRAPAHRAPPAALVGEAGAGGWDGSARELVRIVRGAVRDSAGRGTDWRDVVTSLRPITPALWWRMPARERERFLTRVRSFWEVVRHRAAPEVAATVADLLASKQLSVRAGRLLRVEPAGAALSVTFRPRGSGLAQTHRFERVINCLGPRTDLARTDTPLLRSLLGSGLVSADPLGLGLSTDEHAVALTPAGAAAGPVWVIGPLRKGQTWENTAVPELRRETAAVAGHVARTLGLGSPGHRG